jgi:hypothetical protein
MTASRPPRSYRRAALAVGLALAVTAALAICRATSAPVTSTPGVVRTGPYPTPAITVYVPKENR